MPRISVLAAGLLCTILLCLPAQASAAGSCARTLPTGSTTITVASGGLQRTAIVHVPADLPAGPVPLLMLFHGAGQDGAYFEQNTGFSTIADAVGAIAVYPFAMGESRAGGRPFWNINDSDPAQPDDVGFARDLITMMQQQGCTDPARTFATGMSNGGSMVSRLGCELSDRIAAIAPISGGYGSQPPCVPVRPVSVLEIHGTADRVVPYVGRGASAAGAVYPYLARWASWDGCTGAPAQRLVAARTLRLRWRGCASGTAVEHLRIHGGVHQLPGGTPPEPGPAAPLSAPLTIWRFFAAHPAAA
jgi:polyhydroxybutyrate depolymerase